MCLEKIVETNFKIKEGYKVFALRDDKLVFILQPGYYLDGCYYPGLRDAIHENVWISAVGDNIITGFYVNQSHYTSGFHFFEHLYAAKEYAEKICRDWKIMKIQANRIVASGYQYEQDANDCENIVHVARNIFIDTTVVYKQNGATIWI